IAGSVTGEGSRILSVMTSDGRVVLASDQITGAGTPAALTDVLTTSSDVLPVYLDPDGTEYMVEAVTINELGLSASNPAARLAWIVVARQPVADFRRAILDFIGGFRLILLGNVIFVGVFALLFTRVIMNPLNKLTRISREIEAGHLAMRIPELPEDEIGQFADVLRRVVSRLTARLDQLNAAAQVSRIAALTLDLSQSLGRVAHALHEQLGYPEVRIYLADMPRQRLIVQAGAGPESERMMHAATRTPLDESSLIGRAALLGESQVGGGVEMPKFAGGVAQPAEVAIPLQAGGRTLGVLHVVADRPGAFGREDVDILRLICDQIAAAVENARLYDESKSSLVEIEALNRRLTQTAWEEHVNEAEDALRHTLDPEGHWPDLAERITDSVEVRAETFIDASGRNVLAAPLVLRGQPVGTLAVTRPADERWTMDEVVLVESIASRMVMIAEGIRLVEESSRRAERERQVNEVSADLIQRAASVDSILQTALNKLSGALGSDHVSLRIGAPPVEPGHRIASGRADDPNGMAPDIRARNGDGGLIDGSDQPL
ncbi:MAG: GAF domain-containing protein, partial [Anaerolineae bacterium]|nr:GAF domain-containing protein [Anaerolineae bacterium]